MPWWNLGLRCSRERLDATEALLLELGAQAIDIRDAEDEPLYEPLPGDQPVWSESIVTGLFDHSVDTEALQDRLARQLPAQQLASLKIELLPDQAWERAHLEHYRPLRFGRSLWIVPSWHQPPDPEACNILLDPGVAFGTGSHPTTALCLEYLDAHPPAAQSVIDYGCGSGILAIAAHKLGARSIAAIDIDPQALEATRRNAERNGIDPTDWLIALPEREPEPADWLIANILSGPLVELEPLFSRLVRPGGQLLLSGILPQQAEAVTAAYAPHFELDAVTIERDWCRISGRRKP